MWPGNCFFNWQQFCDEDNKYTMSIKQALIIYKSHSRCADVERLQRWRVMCPMRDRIRAWDEEEELGDSKNVVWERMQLYMLDLYHESCSELSDISSASGGGAIYGCVCMCVWRETEQWVRGWLWLSVSPLDIKWAVMRPRAAALRRQQDCQGRRMTLQATSTHKLKKSNYLWVQKFTWSWQFCSLFIVLSFMSLNGKKNPFPHKKGAMMLWKILFSVTRKIKLLCW